MGELSDGKVQDYDAVKSGRLLDMLTFWFFGGKYCLLLQNMSELSWEIKGFTGEVGEKGQAGRK
jgi:hypothetical protein